MREVIRSQAEEAGCLRNKYTVRMVQMYCRSVTSSSIRDSPGSRHVCGSAGAVLPQCESESGRCVYLCWQQHLTGPNARRRPEITRRSVSLSRHQARARATTPGTPPCYRLCSNQLALGKAAGRAGLAWCRRRRRDRPTRRLPLPRPAARLYCSMATPRSARRTYRCVLRSVWASRRAETYVLPI